MNIRVICLVVCCLPSFVYGEGDSVNGEHLFRTQCTTCHMISNAEGQIIAGRAARTGPNLYGVVGRRVGSDQGFRYSQALLDARAAGAAWTKETFLHYSQNPTDWLRDLLQNRRARSKMAYRLRNESDAIDIFAYLQQFE